MDLAWCTSAGTSCPDVTLPCHCLHSGQMNVGAGAWRAKWGMKQRWNTERDIRVLGGKEMMPQFCLTSEVVTLYRAAQQVGGCRIFPIFFFFFGLVLCFFVRWQHKRQTGEVYNRTELYKIEMKWNQLPQNLSNLADILANVEYYWITHESK